MRLGYKQRLGLCAALLAAGAIFLPASSPVVTSEAQRYSDHVKFLASPDLEGRGAGTAGLEKAGAYIADQYKRFGLKAVGEKGSFKQSFQVPVSAVAGPNNRLSVSGSNAVLATGKDFQPISFSASGKVNAPLAFAGYGATAPEFGYDDYADLDVRNKAVMVLRYEPAHFAKPGGGRPPRYTLHSHLANKAINARNRGASALILVNSGSAKEKDELIPFGQIAGPDDARIPVIHVKRAVADAWLRQAGSSLTDLEQKVESSKAPASLPLALTIALTVDIERKTANVQNVLGYLPGKTDEYIVIGAHYDHIGYGHQNSLAPDQAGKVHPGADDNASGTAGLLELARIFSERRSELQRGVLFAAFAGEEIGLVGSAHWVDHPTLPLKNAVAMLNMDMIGRVSGSKLFIGGTGSGTGLKELLERTMPKYDFKVDYTFQHASASDHASFLAKNIPSLFFFSGVHSDYHKPSDTSDKIEVNESWKVVNVVADLGTGLLNGPRPQFTKAQPTRRTNNNAQRGPVLGITPDITPGGKGIAVVEVSAGSAAETAGLQAGDTLLSLNGSAIVDMYDLTYALHGARTGKPVPVIVRRGDKNLTLQVTLPAR